VVKSKSHSTFYLEVSSGSKITIDFADPEIQKMFGNTLLSDDYAESACQGLRKIVREKKV
jgi:23S rRNA A1618 N6-methylase RlmF